MSPHLGTPPPWNTRGPYSGMQIMHRSTCLHPSLPQIGTRPIDGTPWVS